MAPRQAVSDPVTRSGRVVCQPALAFELQHRDRISLPFNGAAGTGSADCELSGSVTDDAVRHGAARIHRFGRRDRLGCCLFRCVLVAVAQCDDESASRGERI